MNFIENNRSAGHKEGTEIVYSKAYAALADFDRKYKSLEQVKANLLEAQKEVSDAEANLELSKDALILALEQHYEGTIPRAIDTMFGVLLIEFNDDSNAVEFKVIKTESYCDLYRIEKTGEEVSA